MENNPAQQALNEMIDPYIRAMFGVYAMKGNVQLVLQDMGTQHGMNVTLGAAIIATPQRLATPGYVHELVVGDMIIRPRGKWASNKYVGYGAGNLFTSEAMFPEGHEVQTLDNGWKPK